MFNDHEEHLVTLWQAVDHVDEVDDLGDSGLFVRSTSSSLRELSSNAAPDLRPKQAHEPV
jgi:hypothetical protein